MGFIANGPLWINGGLPNFSGTTRCFVDIQLCTQVMPRQIMKKCLGIFFNTQCLIYYRDLTSLFETFIGRFNKLTRMSTKETTKPSFTSKS